MGDLLDKEAPEPESLVICAANPWREKAEAAAALGRPFLLKGPDLDSGFVDALCRDHQLSQKTIAPQSVLLWKTGSED